jgi:hypothetical protein
MSVKEPLAMAFRTLRIALLAASIAGVAACGGGGSGGPPVIRSTAQPTGAPAPASLAAITPAPGNSPAPSPGATIDASPVAVPATPLPSMAPVPAPTGSELQNLVGGGTPSKAYLAALAAPIQPQFPLPDSASKSFSGTISSFVSDGFVVNVPPYLDTAKVEAAGAAYAATGNAIAESVVTAHVSGKTVNAVPGGYGALHTGDAVIVLGSGPAADFIADAVIARPGATAPPATSAETIRTSAAAVRRGYAAARRYAQANVNSVTPFTITSTNGNPGIFFPNPPDQVMLSNLFGTCVSFQNATTANGGNGETATYPMELDDISDPSTFQVGYDNALPVQLVNQSYQSMTTYFINYGVSLSFGLNMITSNCATLKDATYPLSFGTLGQGITLASTDTLPGYGNFTQLNHISCPFIPLTIEGPLDYLLNQPTSPSVSVCLDGQLDGDYIYANASIKNAKVTLSPSIPGGCPILSDTVWCWQSSTANGMPTTTKIVPLADPKGAAQEVELALTSMTYNGNLTLLPTFAGSLLFGLPPAAGNSFPQLTVFQVPNGNLAPPFTPKVGITVPATIYLDLMPSEGGASGGVH